MVKPDLKHNYYADLELPTTASIEDVRKAYRKLALQYHPDRNAGKEEECVPRFQAIQAANEVLSDPTIKAKYDQDRRKSGVFPTFSRTPAPTGNPYQATSAYPPPPRRTAPGQWQRPQPTYAPNGSSGADRFSHFPKPNSTPRDGPAADRAQQYRAWQNVQSTNARRPHGQEQAQAPPPPPRSPNPQTPTTGRPRPQRQDTKMPTEEQIRAGMRHTPGTAEASAAGKQSAWQAFNQGNQGKQGMPRRRPPTTPKRSGGFDPNAPGSDERPAPTATGHYGHRHRSEDLGRDPYPPPPPGPPPASGAASPISPRSAQRPFTDPLRPNKSRTANEDAPYAEGNRTSTPYTSFIGEKTQFSSDGLRRSASTRDTTRLNPNSAARPSRARSQSPLRQQQQAKGTSQRDSKIPGMYSDSSDVATDGSSDSSDEPELTQTPEEVDPAGRERRPSSVPNSANPFQPPPDRKMKKPTPPSSKINGSGARPTAGTPQSDGEQPSMQQRASSTNMYASPFISPSHVTPAFSRQRWISESFRSLMSRKSKSKAKIPLWAIPSSVLPSTPPELLNDGLRAAREPGQVPDGQQSFGTDPLWRYASSDTRKAYCVFQAKLQECYGQIEELKLFNMELFLKLLDRFKTGKSIGQFRFRRILFDITCVFTKLNDAPRLLALANDRSSSDSFNIPGVSAGTSSFHTTQGKSRSVENFDTQFSPEGFSGTFQGNPDYFSATGRRSSPARRNPSSRGMRSATADATPTSTPGDMGPPPRPEAAANPVKFSEEEWKNTFKDASWTWAADSKAASKTSSKTPSRQSSRLNSQTSNSDLPTVGTKQQPKVVDDDDVVHLETRSRHSAATALGTNEGDAMDIDTPPHQSDAANTAADETTPAAKDARLYSVPKSAWREQQEKQHQESPSRQHRAPQEPNLKTNLDDLSNVEPFAKSTDGLRNLADMSSTLPFSSEAAMGHATRSYEPEKLQMPPIPKVPEVPARLTKTSWHSYAASFGAYLSHFHNFNKTMLAHFEARQARAEALLQKGTKWLEAAGDTSNELGFGNYLKGTREDEHVRETWNIGCEKHLEAVKAFDKLREHVRKLAASGALVDA